MSNRHLAMVAVALATLALLLTLVASDSLDPLIGGICIAFTGFFISGLAIFAFQETRR